MMETGLRAPTALARRADGAPEPSPGRRWLAVVSGALASLAAALAGGGAARAADAVGSRAAAPYVAVPDPRLALPGAAPVPLLVTVPPPTVLVVAIPYRDPRTGRCLAGFTLNVAGACVRPAPASVVCVPAVPDGPEFCGAAPPDPAPYGTGAALRLNY